MVDRTKELFYWAHSQHFYSWLMRMPWVQGSDSSLGVLLLHPHTLVMWSTEEESCHQSVPGPSEQGRSTGGSGSWPTFSLSQHLKVSSWSATAHWLTQWCLFPRCSGPNETWNFRGIVSSFKILQHTSQKNKKKRLDKTFSSLSIWKRRREFNHKTL